MVQLPPQGLPPCRIEGFDRPGNICWIQVHGYPDSIPANKRGIVNSTRGVAAIQWGKYGEPVRADVLGLDAPQEIGLPVVHEWYKKSPHPLQKEKPNDAIVTYCKAIAVEEREDPHAINPYLQYDFDLFIKQGPAKAVKVDRFTRSYQGSSAYYRYPSWDLVGRLTTIALPSIGPGGLVVEVLRVHRNYPIPDWGFTEEDGLDPFFERTRQAYLITGGKAIRNDELKTWRTPYIERLFVSLQSNQSIVASNIEWAIGLPDFPFFGWSRFDRNASLSKGLLLTAGNAVAGGRHIHDPLELATKPRGSRVEAKLSRQSFNPKILLPDRHEEVPESREIKAYAYGLGLPNDWNQHFWESENSLAALANYFEIHVTPPVI